ncbi:MAG TPA: galactokinase family protein [Bacillota bacterium]|nr:galactokinase family protein [Bacillota bacterium]
MTLEQEFERLYGAAPQVVRAPGRVNLIGEHTDYNGLPVFPMAIGREIRLAFAPREDNWIEIQNSDPGFPSRRFLADANITPYEKGDWGNYVKAAVLDIVKRENLTQPVGMNVLVSGTIPIASGLSSSTAVVVASALAFLQCNGIAWEPAALAVSPGGKVCGHRGGRHGPGSYPAGKRRPCPSDRLFPSAHQGCKAAGER